MKKEIVVCDIDDVLWDLVTPWIMWYNKYNVYDDKIKKEDITCWNLRECLDIPNMKFLTDILSGSLFWDFVIEYNYSNILYNKMILKSLWRRDDIDLKIATGTDYTKQCKFDCFLKMFDFLTKDDIITIKEKWLLDVDYIIDDNPETIQKCFDKGIKTICIDKQWNKDCDSTYREESFGVACEKIFGGNDEFFSSEVSS